MIMWIQHLQQRTLNNIGGFGALDDCSNIVVRKEEQDGWESGLMLAPCWMRGDEEIFSCITNLDFHWLFNPPCHRITGESFRWLSKSGMNREERTLKYSTSRYAMLMKRSLGCGRSQMLNMSALPKRLASSTQMTLFLKTLFLQIIHSQNSSFISFIQMQLKSSHKICKKTGYKKKQKQNKKKRTDRNVQLRY